MTLGQVSIFSKPSSQLVGWSSIRRMLAPMRLFGSISPLKWLCRSLKSASVCIWECAAHMRMCWNGVPCYKRLFSHVYCWPLITALYCIDHQTSPQWYENTSLSSSCTGIKNYWEKCWVLGPILYECAHCGCNPEPVKASHHLPGLLSPSCPLGI